VGSEREKVQKLFDALLEAKRKAGEDVSKGGNLDSFEKFVQTKTDQIRKQYGCHSVEYSVEMDGGQVRLKAKAKV
jgi:CRISPR/Cas system CSM-associated protein Csm2 small subunit